MRFLKFSIFIISFVLLQSPAYAALDLMLTHGVSNAIPIAIVPFAGSQAAQAPDNVSSVITADLQNSGQFKTLDSQKMSQLPHDAQSVDYGYWRKQAVDNVVVGAVKPLGGDRYQVSFSLLDVFKGQDQAMANKQVLLTKEYTVPNNQLRQLAHHISDVIYQQLIGVRGVFSTHIAYVLVQRNQGQPTQYILEVADADGYNPKALLTSPQPIMSPAWSHDGKRLAYVSFEDVMPQVFIQDVTTGARHSVSHFPGINGAPAWSPDDRKIALVLSKDGTPKIYIMDLASKQLRQVTHDSAIDTEPDWSPDGKSLIFTSDRGGGPQIYRLNFATGETTRLTFNGNYNARASFTPDGQAIVMINRQQDMYNIAQQDLQSGSMLLLTRSGYDASPSISPNGRMVLYESNVGSLGMLGMVSMDGSVQLHLPAQEGSVQDPAWSYY